MAAVACLIPVKNFMKKHVCFTRARARILEKHAVAAAASVFASKQVTKSGPHGDMHSKVESGIKLLSLRDFC